MNRKPTFQNGEVIDGKYRVLRTLFGGMGEVIICQRTQQDEGEPIVLKTYFDDFMGDDDARKRFIREAEAWLDFGSAGACHLLGLKGIIRINGKPYQLMDYCPGGNLRDKLSNGPLDLDRAVLYATQILLALYVLDDKHGMVHRDLKLKNILFDRDDQIVLSDLGIVKFLQDSTIAGNKAITRTTLTQYGAFVGTVPYGGARAIHAHR